MQCLNHKVVHKPKVHKSKLESQFITKLQVYSVLAGTANW